MSNCKHPKGFVSNIGNYKICNLCGQKFFKKDEPKPVIEEDVKKVEDLKEVPAAEFIPPEVKPEAKVEPVEEPKPVKVEEPKAEQNEAPKAKKPRKKKNNKK